MQSFGKKFISLSSLPKTYDHAAKEIYWKDNWLKLGIYKFKNNKPREETFIVDTPPPTVSGSLHIGHLYSYTHTDLLVRFQRMKGKDIYYPMGFDDNGLPTERRVQNYFGVKCDATLPYDSTLEIKPQEDQSGKNKSIQSISRQNFIELCQKLTHQDEQAFINLWQRLGLSVDWTEQYATINDHCRKTSQLSFLDLMKKGRIYQSEAPMMWDVDFQTSVAQAEVEEKELNSALHTLQFPLFESEESLLIATTRPELLPACGAIVFHPEDTRYLHLKGKYAITPLFKAKVPIFTSTEVKKEKGTGLVMVCTFGDQTDVQWWQEFKLPLKQVIGKDGKMLPIQFEMNGIFNSIDPKTANENYDKIKGISLYQARKKLMELLKNDGALKSSQNITHAVKFFEKGSTPLEFMSTRQWYVRIVDKKEELLGMGKKLTWHPEFMCKKFIDWTENLKYDWCISRQRYFGVPFPVWYPTNKDNEPDFANPILADPQSLPVDPTIHCPPGFKPEQRNQPNGFIGEDIVFDTWFTSSVTPQIGSKWLSDPERHKKLFPMDLRPQSHEIIRTWTFYTVAKSLFHENSLPWRHVGISGWVLATDGEKMSKSKGNVITPMPLLEKYSSDGSRYWSALAKLGSDTIFDVSVLQNGKRLVLKIFNAGKFVFSQQTYKSQDITHEIDLAFLAQLKDLVKNANESFSNFEHSVVLTSTEYFFYHGLTDNYIELLRHRLANGSEENKASAVNTLRFAMSIFLRLFAPFLPYITEEVWSWCLAEETGIQSIHLAAWPTVEEFQLMNPPKFPETFRLGISCLEEIRKLRASQKLKAKEMLPFFKFTASESLFPTLQLIADDAANAMNVEKYELIVSE